MTKIYEALDSASKANTQSLPGKPLPKGMMDKLVSLYQRLETLMEERRCAVIAFAGGQQGDDSAKLLCETAKLAASRLNRRVLLIAAESSPSLRQLGAAGADGWEAMAQDGALREESLQPVAGSSLFVSQMTGGGGTLTSILSSPLLANVFDALRQRFDMILIAAPALDRSSDAVMLAPLTDGMVLVINAGGTRWQVAKRWIEQISIHKGKVLGVLFNKRRDYIPYFIYSRL